MLAALLFPMMFAAIVIVLFLATGIAKCLPHVSCAPAVRVIFGIALFLVGVTVTLWWFEAGANNLTAILAFGLDEYRAGLRLVNYEGDLNNGGNLSEQWNAAQMALAVLGIGLSFLPLLVFQFISEPLKSQPIEPSA